MKTLLNWLAWHFKIGWQYDHSEKWLCSYSHLYRNTKTGEERWNHDVE